AHLALLNARLLDFRLRNVTTTFHGGYFAANKQYIEQLPVRLPRRSATLIELVETMLGLQRERAKARHPQDKERIEREINATDRQIDRLVYELYGLSDEEIRI